MKILKLILVLFCFISLNTFAANNTAKQLPKLFKANTLKCTFDKGVSAEYKELDIPISRTKDKNFTLIYDSIYQPIKRAKLIGNQGSTSVLAFMTPAGIHFIEFTKLGNINVTTVFTNIKNPTSNEFYAVHSRHVNLIIGPPLPSQRYGTCKVWDL